nr:hypothetical protein [uncultured Methanoregula sp.]
MRIVAIGLGGAGSRIVDRLYATDRRSSKVACVQGLAVDVEEECLKNLESLPDSAKLFFPPLDPHFDERNRSAAPTAAIDISEIIAKIQNFESGETDAIVICLGLGGSLTDVAPHVIAGLRSAIVEPIFGLVTLPCLAEGEKRSAKAADDIDILAPLLDGMILFDNETWYKKTAALKEKILNREKGFVERLGFGKQEQEISPQMVTYRLLNDTIVRRISLILRAGEFRADGGIDLAEVVLDSGEVLNTMKGMGFITIGYAVEHTTNNPLGFLGQLRPKGIFDEENKKKASRVVDLAKQAIYNEISTPCDMTSAHKALILVAGPTHELSMKGFMTVRKWIDRSIAGLETRSGDYPVMNTKNIAVIIMLSGLENIPRIEELREIREYYRHPSIRGAISETAEAGAAIRSPRRRGEISDEMIVLPQNMQKSRGESQSVKHREESPSGEGRGEPRPEWPQVPGRNTGAGMPPVARPDINTNVKQAPAGQVTPPLSTTGDRGTPGRSIPPAVHTRPKVTQQDQIPPMQKIPDRPPQPRQHPPSPPTEQREPVKPIDTGRPSLRSSMSTPIPPKETPRQRIERELQQQRIIATPDRVIKSGHEPAFPQQPPRTVIKPREVAPPERPERGKNEPGGPVDVPGQGRPAERRTVIISRKKTVPPAPPLPETSPVPKQEKYIPADESFLEEVIPEEFDTETKPEGQAIEIKEPSFRARDQIFEGKTVQKGFVPLPRDSALLKANLHLGRKTQNATDPDSKNDPEEQAREGEESRKTREKSIKKKDDISWI